MLQLNKQIKLMQTDKCLNKDLHYEKLSSGSFVTAQEVNNLSN